MRKKTFIKLFVFLVLGLVFYCKSADVTTFEYILEGTVTFNDQPVTGIDVEAGHKAVAAFTGSEFYNEFTAKTDNSGNYTFTVTTRDTDGRIFHARVKHPQTLTWTDWKESRHGAPGVAFKIDFFLK